MIEYANIKMEDLIIEQTLQSPKVNFKKNGDLIIRGVSTISHARKFYSEPINWLNEFKKTAPEKLNLVLELYYLNTSSSLIIVDLLHVINSFKSDKTNVRIEWRYEEDDEDILNFGEDVEVTTKSAFEFVRI